MTKRRSLRAAAALAAGFVLCAGLPARASTPLVLTYSIREARAFALKVSLSKQELQLIPPCNPKTDPYGCDTSQYEHTPNCPASIALGRTKPGPEPAPPSTSVIVSGGESNHVGSVPNQSSPVRLNKLLVIGRLGNSGDFPSAGGLASDEYVDLNGRQTPAAHTQSEAFSNLPDYEERCNPTPVNTSSYEHLLSRSGEGPATYHLAECFGSECTFGAGVSVQHALEIVDLRETAGQVVGTIRSELQGVNLIPGVASIDLLETYVSIHSDGTGKGLAWSVATTLSGLTIAGQKVALPGGATIPVNGITIGLVAPYVAPSNGGHAISIMAPGLALMSDQQSIFLGGAELYGTFDREPAASFNPFKPGIVPPVAIPSVLPPPLQTIPRAPAPVGRPVAAPQFAIRMYDTGLVAITVILAAGFAAMLLIFLRWSRRWAWGRKVCCVQPFAGIDWLYRAFVKT
ncbi:MAG TPA: hypothetical protein VKV69_08545 [Actinomycetota bacterium]|nr:hypothetical protein [Actinomycetota bacterium]